MLRVCVCVIVMQAHVSLLRIHIFMILTWETNRSCIAIAGSQFGVYAAYVCVCVCVCVTVIISCLTYRYPASDLLSAADCGTRGVLPHLRPGLDHPGEDPVCGCLQPSHRPRQEASISQVQGMLVV